MNLLNGNSTPPTEWCQIRDSVFSSAAGRGHQILAGEEKALLLHKSHSCHLATWSLYGVVGKALTDHHRTRHLVHLMMEILALCGCLS